MSIGKKIGRTVRRLRAFLANDRANVAMIFGLSLVPITLAAGAGLDLTRAMIVKSNLTEAVDAAALAVASTSTHTTMTQSDMNLEAKQYFWANYTLNTTAYGAPPTQPTVTPGTQSVTVTSNVNVPTTLMRIAKQLGVAKWPYVTVNATSTVVWGQTKLWVSLVLDNTGSMTQSDSTGTTKISALQTATHQLLTMLQGASANAGDVEVCDHSFLQDRQCRHLERRRGLDRLDRLGSGATRWRAEHERRAQLVLPLVDRDERLPLHHRCHQRIVEHQHYSVERPDLPERAFQQRFDRSWRPLLQRLLHQRGDPDQDHHDGRVDADDHQAKLLADRRRSDHLHQ